QPLADGQQFFRERIEPVLKRECYSCHSQSAGAELAGGLRLDASNWLRAGGDSGPAVDPQRPAESLLLQALKHTGGLAMPPDRDPLPSAVIADFEQWLKQGAPDPRPAIEDPAPTLDLEKAKEHYAFQPIVSPVPPQVADHAETFQAIDAFLLHKLESHDLQFAPLATPGHWLRRVWLDLTGLPPSIEHLRDFELDQRPDAHERVVDRLLASPQYGARWAQHWLDVVRYAESEGYEYDRHLPDAWRYRDYVIDSLNADKPFDQFVTEQIAGDELDDKNPEYLSAAIFHRLGPVRRNAGNPDIALSRNEVLTERTDILGSAFLGLSVGCARCHNHKLEPISQRDYYQLQAYLAATAEHNLSLADTTEQAKWEAETKRIKDEIQALQKAAKLVKGEAKEKLSAQIEALDATLPKPLPTIPTIRNDWSARTPLHVLRRGVWELKGPAVSPGPPGILVSAANHWQTPNSDQTTPTSSTTNTHNTTLQPDDPKPRTKLARWMTNPAHPLTPRVIVNRLWQHHFGLGIVKTANDFGLHGESPSHPELLDYLASQLLQHAWQWKPIHRQILLSRAYRQTDIADQALVAMDPENRWLGRFSRRRLTGEEIRDCMLMVSGQMNLQAHGTSVMLPVDADMVQLLYKPTQWIVEPDQAAHARRSIYLFAKRNLRLPLMENLDAPALLSSCARRESSTHAPQALELMNGWQANQLAGQLAQRLNNISNQPEHTQMIETAFLLAIGRRPTEREHQLSQQFLQTHAVSEFALAMFNLNEFVYVR
ncbi:MAG: PSD1 domain-containing protein, partial [Pirellulaceae bacterium]|nr:PSD1 domain-containing protein [Pirellulaceae bacterium]